MIAELILAVITPVAGTVAYAIGKKEGYSQAIATARAESEHNMRVEIDMLVYEDHIKIMNGQHIPGHVCGKTCRAMAEMNARKKVAPPRYDLPPFA